MIGQRNVSAYLVPGVTAGVFLACLLWVAGNMELDFPMPFGFLSEPFARLLALARRRPAIPMAAAFVFVGAGLGAGLGGLLWLRRRAYDRSLAQRSAEMGFVLQADVARSDLPDLPLFRDWSAACNRMSGRWGGVPVELVDYTAVTKDDDSHHTTRTVVLMPAEGLREFTLRPRTMILRQLQQAGIPQVTFDPAGAANEAEAEAVAQFNRLYHLTARGLGSLSILAERTTDSDQDPPADTDETALRLLFTPALMHSLTALPGWSVQSHGGHLALWRGWRACPAAARPALLDEALAIRTLLVRAAAEPSSRAPLAAQPGMSAVERAARARAKTLGAGVGLVLGFFGGFAAYSAVFFQQVPGQARPDAALGQFGAFVLGGLLVGVALGNWLGGWLLTGLFRPRDPAETPAQQRARRRVTNLGAGLGFMLGSFGAPIGSVSLALALRPRMDFALIAPVFFGLGALGAVGGAILGGFAASRLYRLFRRRAKPAEPPGRPGRPDAGD